MRSQLASLVKADMGRVRRRTFLKSLPSQLTRSFVFVNNLFEGHSPATVARLRTLLGT